MSSELSRCFRDRAFVPFLLVLVAVAVCLAAFGQGGTRVMFHPFQPAAASINSTQNFNETFTVTGLEGKISTLSPVRLPASDVSLPEVTESDAQGELEMKAASSDVVTAEVAEVAEIPRSETMRKFGEGKEISKEMRRHLRMRL